MAATAALMVGSATAEAAGPGIPAWHPAPCDEVAASPEVASRLRCGVVEVLRDRAASDGRTFGLAVVVIHPATAQPQPDPVVYIAGGPGSPLTSEAGSIAIHQAGILAPDRDLILVDQRGAGRSEPSLCPGLAREQLALFASGLDDHELAQARQTSFAGCGRAMDASGLWPEWFGTQVTAACKFAANSDPLRGVFCVQN